MGPMIAMGSAKAQGSKAKPIGGSESPRATTVRDEATKRVANILTHLRPCREDLVPTSFVFAPGFLHAPLWAGI
jgi:hypothetical protein